MSEGRTNLSEPLSSKEPVQFPTKVTANAADADSVTTGLAELAGLARRAFEEKRRKNCLALTSAILKIDPNHKEALVIQSWVRSDLGQDLEKARKVFEDARLRRNPVGYDRAEIMLQSLLSVDPDNDDAKALLHEIISTQPPALARAPLPDPGPAMSEEPPLPPISPMMPPVPLSRPVNVALGLKKMVLPVTLVALIGAAIVAGIIGMGMDRAAEPSSEDAANATGPGTIELTMDNGVQVFVNDELKGTTPLPPMSLEPGEYRMRYQLDGQTFGEEVVSVSAGSVARNGVTTAMGRLNLIVVPSSSTRMSVDRGNPQAVPSFLQLKAGNHQIQFTAEGYAPEVLNLSIKAGEDQYQVVTLKPGPAAPATRTETPAATRPTNPPPAGTAQQNSVNAAQEPAAAALGLGTVALSAAIPVEIYDGERLLGATPTTLTLTEGTHTLEFRYRQLRKTQSIVVSAYQTTTATISFETTVQINARPFAQVLVDGVQMRSLGETPLSNVSLPIGSVLVFRHASFGEKRVRVTGGETTIQVVFP